MCANIIHVTTPITSGGRLLLQPDDDHRLRTGRQDGETLLSTAFHAKVDAVTLASLVLSASHLLTISLQRARTVFEGVAVKFWF